MPYWQLYYHVVWGTRGRQPWITPDLEPIVHGFIREKAKHLGGRVFALDGTEDHVHLVTTIPPKVAISHFIGQVKGFVSSGLNQSGLLRFRFAWQAEYGVFSLDRKRLRHHVAYVERQKEHHAESTLIPALEPRETPKRGTPPPASAGAAR